jgi:hypothetical protein
VLFLVHRIFVTLMKETLSSSETSVLMRATRRNIPEDDILHSHRRENLKCWTLNRFTVLFYILKVSSYVNIKYSKICERPLISNFIIICQADFECNHASGKTAIQCITCYGNITDCKLQTTWRDCTDNTRPIRVGRKWRNAYNRSPCYRQLAHTSESLHHQLI